MVFAASVGISLLHEADHFRSFGLDTSAIDAKVSSLARVGPFDAAATKQAVRERLRDHGVSD